MSSVIYATPVFNMMMRYNRTVEEGGAEMEHSELDQAGRTRGPLSQTRSDHRTSLRSAAVCLGVLCILLAAGVIILSVRHVSVASEKQQLEAKLSNLSVRYNHSLNHIKLLQDQFTGRNQQQAAGECEGESCPDGWVRFGCSCYFTSTKLKTWPQSRTDCRSRGSDLVVISSGDEQDFVRGLNVDGSWIGLRTTLTAGGVWRWEWVDESPLMETFWARVHSDPPRHWTFAGCCSPQGKWTEIQSFSVNRKWICEKRIKSQC